MDIAASAPPAASPDPDATLRRRQRGLFMLFAVLLATGFVATVLLQALPLKGVRDPTPLQQVRDADEMVNELACQNHGWPSPLDAVPPGKAASANDAADAQPPRPAPAADCNARTPARPGGPGVALGPVTWALGFDSVFIVPGYTGLFMLAFAFLFAREWPRVARRSEGDGLGGYELALMLLCVIPVAAAAFDLAENGITMIAIEDAVSRVLANATVDDMHLATTCKWALFGLSCFVAGALAIVGELRRLIDGFVAAPRAGEFFQPGAIHSLDAPVIGFATHDANGHGGHAPRDWRAVLSELDFLLVGSGLAGIVAALALRSWIAAPSMAASGVAMVAFTVQMICLGCRIWVSGRPSAASRT